MTQNEERAIVTISRRILTFGAIALLAAIVIGEGLSSSRAHAQGNRVAASRTSPVAAAESARSASPEVAKPAVRINLNTASESELLDLPGVGPKKAALIVDWRTKHGPFQRPQDIRRVKGFGRKTFERLAPFLTVGDRPAAPHH